jgi:hypothetical protein
MLLPGAPSRADLDTSLEIVSEVRDASHGPKQDAVSLSSFSDPNIRHLHLFFSSLPVTPSALRRFVAALTWHQSFCVDFQLILTVYIGRR